MAVIYDLADTWADGATTFTSIKMNVTDTASASGSRLMQLQVGGGTAFEINKTGRTVFAQPGVPTSSIILQPSSYNLSLQIYSGTAINFSAFNGMLQPYGNRIVIGNSYTAGAQLWRDGVDNVLALRNSTNAQTFNLYNTYTDASNYERGFMKWNSNVLEIGTEAAGTGAARNTAFYHGATKIFEVTSNALNIASSSQLLTFGNGANIFGGASLLYTTTSTGVHRLRTSSGTDTFKVGPGYVELAEPETVATLPGSPVVGMMARVTDATAPAVGSTVTGGGAANALCWYNGTNWTVIGV